MNSGSKENNEDSQCLYTGSGKIPLLCAAIAFVGLAVAMVVEHMYMLIAVTKATPSDLVVWDPNSAYSKTITWQAGFFFVTTWYDQSVFASSSAIICHLNFYQLIISTSNVCDFLQDMFCSWGNLVVNWAECGVRAFEELV